MTEMTWRQMERLIAVAGEAHGLTAPRSGGLEISGWDKLKEWAPKRTKART